MQKIETQINKGVRYEKKNKRIYGMGCCLFFLLFLLCSFPTYASSLTQQKEQITQELNTYQLQFEISIKEIETSETKITEKINELTETNLKLEEAELTKNKQYEEMKARIKCLYEMGNYQIWETILESKNISSALNHIEFVSELQKYDQKKLKEYEENLNKITKLKESLEIEQKELESLKEEQQTHRDNIKKIIDSKESQLQELDKKIQQELVSQQSTGTFTRNGNSYSYNDSDFDLICAIVAQESNTSYEGALAVITCALNRAESSRWQYAGTDPLSQLKAPGQFCYSIDNHWRKRLNGNYPEHVKQAVLDGLNGARNHNYLSFRGYATAGSVSIGGNWYFSTK